MMETAVRKKISRMGASYDTDAMSGYNPHSHALVVRSDRVDYSVTKGGLRVWIALVVFILFVGGIISIISDGDMANLANALDVDGDGDHDNVDDDDGDDRLHEDSAAKAARQLSEKEPSKMRRSGGGSGKVGAETAKGVRFAGHKQEEGGGGDDEDEVLERVTVDVDDEAYIPRKSKKARTKPLNDVDEDEFDEAEMLSKIGALPRGFDDRLWEEVPVQEGSDVDGDELPVDQEEGDGFDEGGLGVAVEEEGDVETEVEEEEDTDTEQQRRKSSGRPRKSKKRLLPDGGDDDDDDDEDDADSDVGKIESAETAFVSRSKKSFRSAKRKLQKALVDTVDRISEAVGLGEEDDAVVEVELPVKSVKYRLIKRGKRKHVAEEIISSNADGDDDADGSDANDEDAEQFEDVDNLVDNDLERNDLVQNELTTKSPIRYKRIKGRSRNRRIDLSSTDSFAEVYDEADEEEDDDDGDDGDDDVSDDHNASKRAPLRYSYRRGRKTSTDYMKEIDDDDDTDDEHDDRNVSNNDDDDDTDDDEWVDYVVEDAAYTNDSVAQWHPWSPRSGVYRIPSDPYVVRWFRLKGLERPSSSIVMNDTDVGLSEDFERTLGASWEHWAPRSGIHSIPSDPYIVRWFRRKGGMQEDRDADLLSKKHGEEGSPVYEVRWFRRHGKTAADREEDDKDVEEDDVDADYEEEIKQPHRKQSRRRKTGASSATDAENEHDDEDLGGQESSHGAWHSWHLSASDSPVRYYRTHDGKEVDFCRASDKDCHEHHIRRGDVEVRFRRIKGKPRGSKMDDDDDDDDDEEEKVVSKHSRATAKRASHPNRSSKKSGQPHPGAGTLASLRTVTHTGDTAVSHPPVPKSYYRKAGITSRDDNRIRGRLDDADLLLAENRLDEALAAFKEILVLYKDSPRAHYGQARTLDALSERRQSNPLLEQSIDAYETLLNLPNVPDELYLLTAKRFVDRCRFRGSMHRALKVQREIIDKFPNNLGLLNDYGVTFLMIGRNEDAKRVFQDVLRLDPNNAIAQVHYGFILKTIDNDNIHGVEYLLKGVQSDMEEAQDGRFYYHLGDGLQRLGRTAEAFKIHQKGAEKGFFLSAFQRSLYNVDHLKSQPWWTMQETGFQKQLKTIEKQWKIIRAEGLALLNQETNTFEPEEEKLTDKGDWKQFTLFQKGIKFVKNCRKTPRTCQTVEKLPEAVNCKRGQIKFSVMEPGTRVHPHCGPTNCRIRSHLGLVVPEGPHIRVGNETRTWTEGKFIIFDDSFEHEVWHDGDSMRLVLIIDFWHPDLTPEQQKSLSPI